MMTSPRSANSSTESYSYLLYLLTSYSILNSPGKNSLFRALFGLVHRELVAGKILKSGQGSKYFKYFKNR